MTNELKDITETTGLYYYITMKEFEKNDGRKNKQKYQKLTSQDKRLLHEKLSLGLHQIFSYAQFKKTVRLKSLRINNYEDLFLFFAKGNLFDLLKQPETLDTFFPCSLIEGNFAWISKNHVGHYRYFSKGKESVTIGLDLVDLLQIYFGVNISQTIELAVKDFNIKFMEDVWMDKQNQKYLSNLTLIHSMKKKMEQEAPILYDYLKGHAKVLETLNVIANINIKKQEFGWEGHNVFFASNSYIANFLGNYTISTTNKAINLFAVLGIIKKVHEKDIPTQLLHESKVIAERGNKGNIISYYIIPPMIDILDVANERSKILHDHSISVSNITRAKIAFVFGEEFADSVYVQEIQKNKLKRAEIPTSIHVQLESHLAETIHEKGYATKKLVAKKSIKKTTMKDRQRELEKIWKSLLLKHKITYIKPTEKMKKDHQLKTSEYIAIKTNEKEVGE